MSQIVKTFLHAFSNSLIPKSSYYRKILDAKLSFSLKYFFMLIVFLNLFILIFFMMKISPFKIRTLLSNLSQSLDRYPSDLEIQIKKGTVSTNYDRPYFLWLDNYENESKHLLAVIDASAQYEKINEYDSFILVTTNEIIFKNLLNNNHVTRNDLSFIENETINKGTILKVQNSIIWVRHNLFIIYPVSLFIIFILLILLSFFEYMIYLTVVSAIIYVLTLFKHSSVKKALLNKVFQISLHSVTLPLSLNYSLGILRPPIFSLLTVFLLLLILFTFVGVNEGFNYKLHRKAHLPHKKK